MKTKPSASIAESPYRDAAVRFTDDGSLVAVAGGDGVRILDANSGQMLQVIDAAGSAITDISWIPQSHLLLVGAESWLAIESGGVLKNAASSDLSLCPISRSICETVRMNLPASQRTLPSWTLELYRRYQAQNRKTIRSVRSTIPHQAT